MGNSYYVCKTVIELPSPPLPSIIGFCDDCNILIWIYNPQLASLHNKTVCFNCYSKYILPFKL